MIYGNDPVQYRRLFCEAWRKQLEGTALHPLEDLVARVATEHPEYHRLLEDPATLTQEYAPESGQTNPFLHMGLHIAIREQLASDRPAGIREVHRQLMQRHADPHDVEHRMAECLAEGIWEAQRNGTAPDEDVYLERLRKL